MDIENTIKRSINSVIVKNGNLVSRDEKRGVEDL